MGPPGTNKSQDENSHINDISFSNIHFNYIFKREWKIALKMLSTTFCRKH